MQPLCSNYPHKMKDTRVAQMKMYPHPLCTTPCIQHVCSLEHASFKPAHSTPHRPVTCTPTHSPAKPVRCCLSFNNDSMDTPDRSSTSSPEPSDLEEEEEGFQTLPLDDEFWSTEIVPEWTLCIHKNGLPNSVYPDPLPLWE